MRPEPNIRRTERPVTIGAMSADSSPVRFETTLSSFGNNTGIVIPDDVVAQLASGKRPSVIVTVNGYEFRSTVAVMGKQSLLGVSSAIRKDTGLRGGDPISVALALAEGPREVNVPDDFLVALDAEPPARAFFDALANSLQRYHVDNITGAKTAETRRKRVQKAVALFLDGKKR